MLLNLLDLAGVALVGVVSVLSVTTLSGQPVPENIDGYIRWLFADDGDSIALVLLLSAIAGALLILKSGASFGLVRVTFRFLARKQAETTLQVTAALFTQPLGVLRQKASQDTAFVLTAGFGAAITIILGGTATALADVALLVFFGLGLLIVDPTISVFTIVYFSLIGWVLYRSLMSRAKRLGVEATELDIETYMLVQDAIQSYREVVALNRRSLYVQRMKMMLTRIADVATSTQVMTALPKYVFEVALVFGALILAATQFYTRDATQAVGILAVFVAAASRVTPAILRLQGASIGIRRAQAPAEKALAMADQARRAETSSPAALNVARMHSNAFDDYPGFKPSIEVCGVSLSYAPDAPLALNDVSFHVDPGMSVGIVGVSGAGKSSLADVILGVVPPMTGSAMIGDLPPLQAISKWSGAIAYVPQSVAVMGGSVRENVAYGIAPHEIHDGLVSEALERAHLAEFLATYRDGLETIVGEDGVLLSGGQRQRLGIARALYSRPRLVVLDEATSALDTETERAFIETVAGFGDSVTTVTIAHRLSTVRNCDLLVYLEEGQVAALGSFQDLRDQSPAFDRQVKLSGL